MTLLELQESLEQVHHCYLIGILESFTITQIDLKINKLNIKTLLTTIFIIKFLKIYKIFYNVIPITRSFLFRKNKYEQRFYTIRHLIT